MLNVVWNNISPTELPLCTSCFMPNLKSHKYKKAPVFRLGFVIDGEVDDHTHERNPRPQRDRPLSS